MNTFLSWSGYFVVCNICCVFIFYLSSRLNFSSLSATRNYLYLFSYTPLLFDVSLFLNYILLSSSSIKFVFFPFVIFVLPKIFIIICSPPSLPAMLPLFELANSWTPLIPPRRYPARPRWQIQVRQPI